MGDVQIEFSSSGILDNPLVQLGLGIIFLIFLLVVLALIIRFFTQRRGKVSATFQKKVIMVTMPKDAGKDKGDNPPNLQQVQEKIGSMETFFSTIAGLKAEKGIKKWFFGFREVFSLEIVADKEGKINFYIAMPAHLQQYVEEQIHAQFPSAFIDEVTDYNIFSPKGKIDGRQISFDKSFIFPIKTYKKFEADPLNSIANALSKIEKGDGAAIQFVIKSAPAQWHNLGVKVASKMQQGKKLNDALAEVTSSQFFKSVFKALKTKDKNQPPPEQYKLSPMEEEVVKALEEKSSKAGLDVNIRVMVSSENEMKLARYLNDLTNAFSQYTVYKYGNALKGREVSMKRLVHDFIYRNFEHKGALVFNTEEMASLFHFPIPLINETPNIRWLESKKAPPPFNAPETGFLLGKNIYRGKETLIRMKEGDRRRHVYIIGMTGTGKSYFMSGLTMQDILAGNGCCYIDPHGDDLENILTHIPKERAEDVIFFDPADMERPIGLNMLEYENPEQKTFVVNEIMNIFDKLYDLKATGGPMFEQYFKNACYLVMDDPESGATLMEIPRVLADDDFRKLKLSKCKSQIVKDFWEKEAQKAGGEASLANMVPYITSKLTPFIANDIMRPIISQQKSSFNFKEAMDSKKIILVKLSKGKIGDINANLLGMIIVGKILMAALARADTPESERKDFYLYIDEFQNFLTESIQIILSEARKYRLCLTIAHQYLGQLIKNGDTRFKDAIFGNVGTKVSFRIGVDDAEALAKEFAPVFSEYDFLNVPAYNCFVKELIDNANPPGFNMQTLRQEDAPIAPKNVELGEAIKQLSRLKYGKERELIEMEINERIKKFS